MRKLQTFLTIGTVATMLLPAISMAASTRVSDTQAARLLQTAAITDTQQKDDSVGASTADEGALTVTSTQAANFFNNFLRETGGSAGSAQLVFDVRAFRSHPCFETVGSEQEYCHDIFGITQDFASMMQDNSLGTLLAEHILSKRCDNLTGADLAACESRNIVLLPQLAAQLSLQTGTGSVFGTEVASEMTEEEAPDPIMTRHERSQLLWEMCASHDDAQAGCYQQFLRFVTDTTIEPEEIMKVIGE